MIDIIERAEKFAVQAHGPQKRKYSDVILFLNNLLKTNLKNSGIPKGLEKDFKKGVKIVHANKVSNKSINEAIRNIAVTDETIFS